MSKKKIAMMPDEPETWRPVPGMGGKHCVYEVSSLGRLRSVRVTILQPYLNPKRTYHQFGLIQRGRRTPKQVHAHSLVAAAFLGPRPPGQWVCHNDGNPQNNRLSNLRYDTPQGNSADMVAHGTSQRGERNHNAILTEAQVRAIRACRGLTYRQIAAEFEVSFATVQLIKSGRSWRHV